MVRRLLSVAFVCVFNVAAHAQLPSDSFSPLNHLGRFYGFGYSEGYHACKDGRCDSGKIGSSGSIWKPWESMSTYYSTATAPTSNRVVTQRATSKAPLYSHENCVPPNFGTAPNFGTVAPNFSPSMGVSPQPMYQSPLPTYQVPTYQAPLQSLPKWTPTPQPSYETVPPAPSQSQPSPSDRNRLELPAPQKPEQVPSSPKVDPRDVSSNYYPQSQESNFRPIKFNPN